MTVELNEFHEQNDWEHDMQNDYFDDDQNRKFILEAGNIRFNSFVDVSH